MRRHTRDHGKRQPSGPDGGKNQSMQRELRGKIASAAARLIAEDGVTNFAAARLKAARQMGITENGALPDDREIDAALRLHQALFQGDSQPQECRALRRLAVDAMRWLDRFSPWLTGAVLNGTANRFSEIELEIISADAKQVALFFMNERMPFDTRVKHAGQPQRGLMPEDIVIYVVTFNEVPVVITLYSQHAERQAHHPGASLKHARLQLIDVEALFAK